MSKSHVPNTNTSRKLLETCSTLGELVYNPKIKFTILENPSKHVTMNRQYGAEIPIIEDYATGTRIQLSGESVSQGI